MGSDEEGRTKVKICGLANLEDARFAAGALADYLGFIFYRESPRFIDPARAGAIIQWIEGPKTVGVFVNAPLDEVNRIAAQTGIDLIQLHGNESPEYCSLIDKPVIKALRAEPGNGLDLTRQIQPYRDVVDYLLFDSSDGRNWGGTGKTFDWSLLNDLQLTTPWFLSGGLNSDNIVDACNRHKPYAVDLSSGLEQAPGIKDYEKIELFFEKMRTIWNKQNDERQ